MTDLSEFSTKDLVREIVRREEGDGAAANALCRGLADIAIKQVALAAANAINHGVLITQATATRRAAEAVVREADRARKSGARPGSPNPYPALSSRKRSAPIRRPRGLDPEDE